MHRRPLAGIAIEITTLHYTKNIRTCMLYVSKITRTLMEMVTIYRLEKTSEACEIIHLFLYQSELE